MEEHGNALFQDSWVATELENLMPGKQERCLGEIHFQDQSCGWEDVVATRCDPRHYLKFHKGADEEDVSQNKIPVVMWLPSQDLVPWWKALNVSLEME